MDKIEVNIYEVNYQHRNISQNSDPEKEQLYLAAVNEDAIKDQITSWCGTGDYRCKIDSCVRIGKLTIRARKGVSLENVTKEFNDTLKRKGTINLKSEKVAKDLKF